MHNQVAHQNVSLESSGVNLGSFLSGSECTSFLVLQKEIRKKIHGKQRLFIFLLKVRQRDRRGTDSGEIEGETPGETPHPAAAGSGEI